MKPCTYCGNVPHGPEAAKVGSKGCPVCFRSDDCVDVVAGQHLPQPTAWPWNRDTAAAFATILMGSSRRAVDDSDSSTGLWLDRDQAETLYRKLGALLGKHDVPEARPDPTTAISASEWRSVHEYAAMNRQLANQWLEMPIGGGWAKLLFESDLTRECTLVVGDVAIRERAWPRVGASEAIGFARAYGKSEAHVEAIVAAAAAAGPTWTEPQTGAKVPHAPTPWLTQATSAEQSSPAPAETPTWQLPANLQEVEPGHGHASFYLGDALMILELIEVAFALGDPPLAAVHEANAERVDHLLDNVICEGQPYTVTWRGRQWLAVAYPAEN